MQKIQLKAFIKKQKKTLEDQKNKFLEFLQEIELGDFIVAFESLKKAIKKGEKETTKKSQISLLNSVIRNLPKESVDAILIEILVIVGIDVFLLEAGWSPLFISSFIIPEGIFLGIDIMHKLRKAKGLEKGILYLEEKIMEEQQELEEIKQQELTQRKEKKPLKQIELILDQADLNYDYGYNQKKWLLYYKRGVLQKRLEKKGYSEEEIDKVENWVAFDAFKKEENRLLRKLER